MRLEIDMPDHHYNNIMAIKSINLGRTPYKGIVMYAINAIKHGKVLEQEPWCAGCREYDQEKHCCHRWSKVIRDTVEEMKQEPRKGHWLSQREHCEMNNLIPSGLGSYFWCSECNHAVDVREWNRNHYNYCPNCGADMREVEK